MVASINLVVREGQRLRKGDEIGFFKYGGSNVTFLFQRGPIVLDQDLVALSLQGWEVKVRYGARLGRAAQAQVQE